jgi:hypothetical protein
VNPQKGVAWSRIPVFPKLTNPASLREGALYRAPLRNARPGNVKRRSWFQARLRDREPRRFAPLRGIRENPSPTHNRAARSRRTRDKDAVIAADIPFDRRRVGSNRAWRSDPAGPSPSGERRREFPNPAPLLPRNTGPFARDAGRSCRYDATGCCRARSGVPASTSTRSTSGVTRMSPGSKT